jgi:hypothetical protein
MPFSFIFLPSSPLLFPSTPAFFLSHIPLLVLAAAVLVLLPDHLRLLTTTLFFHPSYRLSLLPCDLPLASCLLGQQPPRRFLQELPCTLLHSSPFLCQPMPRGFPYDPALVVLRHCQPPRAPTPGLFSPLERHEAKFRESPEHLISLPSRRWSQ